MQSERMRKAWTWAVLPALVYLGVALALTWPLARGLNTSTPGVGYSDAYEVLRHAWDAHEQIAAGENPLVQTRIAYPQRFTSWLSWARPLRWLPGALLMFVLPPIAALNVWLLGTLVLNGLSAYWLGRALSGGNVWAALLGGLVFMLFPQQQGQLSAVHLDVLAMYGLPLLALCWWRVLFADGGWRSVIAGGVWLTLAALGTPTALVYHVLPVIVLLGAYALWSERGRLFPRGRPLRAWPSVRALALLAWGGVLLSVFYAPLLTRAGQAELADLRETGRVRYSLDALSFVSPSPFGLLARWGLAPAYARDVLGTNAVEGAAYLGVVASALVLVAVSAGALPPHPRKGLAPLDPAASHAARALRQDGARMRRDVRAWLVLALGAALLGLGPLLKWRDRPVRVAVEDVRTYVTLPYAALENLPVLRETRTPGRFAGALALAWSGLVSMGASAVGGVWRAERRALSRAGGDAQRHRRAVPQARLALGAPLALALGVLMFAEYSLWYPFPTGQAAQPAYFHELAARADVRAVYNAPAGHILARMQAMALQVVHGKPLIAGQLYRHSPQNPALIALLDAAVTGQGGALTAPSSAELPALMRAAGADRVILHKRFVPDAAEASARLREAFGAPEFEDAWLAVYVVPPDAPPPSAQWVTGADWARLPDGAALLSAEADVWSIYTPDPFGELRIPVRTVGAGGRVGVAVDGQTVGAWWADAGEMRVPLWLDAGFHTLRITALDGCARYPFAAECVAAPLLGSACEPVDPPLCVSVALGAPQWQALPAPQPLDVALGEGVRLRGWTLEVDEAAQRVHVRLFWQADGPLSADYALFVHLADAETAAPLAQFDGFPLLPTSAWDAGTRWVSDVVLDVSDVPAGEYVLNAGWFVPQTGARLPVQTARRWSDAGLVDVGAVTLP